MSDPYLGEIRLFPFSHYQPVYGYLLCDGTVYPINQYQALAALLGTNFGGNGSSTFGVPNLVATIPIGAGQGTGLSDYVLGETVGSNDVALTVDEMPAHDHTFSVGFTTTAADRISAPNSTTYLGNFDDAATGKNQLVYSAGPANTTMSPLAIGAAGYGLAHENRQPALVACYYQIACEGLWPQHP